MELNELDTLEKLKELAEHIVKNGWEHLFDEVQKINVYCDNDDRLMRIEQNTKNILKHLNRIK